MATISAGAMRDAMKRRLKPKGKRGMAAVKRLGRTYKTGGFERIAESAAASYGRKGQGNHERGRRVAGGQYWAMVRKRRGR